MSETPTYIYKLVSHKSPVPDVLPDVLPLSALDTSSGFIHASTATQVPNTLIHFFTDDPKVYVLRIRYDKIAHAVKWESPNKDVCGPRPGEGLFPHLYGVDLGREVVESVWVLENTADGWGEVVKEDEFAAWMTY